MEQVESRITEGSSARSILRACLVDLHHQLKAVEVDLEFASAFGRPEAEELKEHEVALLVAIEGVSHALRTLREVSK